MPATDRPPTLARCLAALQNGTDAPDELIVVERADAPGPAAARNVGIASATSDVVVFVDADVVVHSDALARLRQAFAADAGLAAVFGAYDDRPEDGGTVSGFRNLLHHHVHASSAGPATTFWAGLGAIRCDALLALDGFDAARYPVPSIEDVELGSRLHAAGGRIELRPDIQGTHLKQWSLVDMVRTDFARRGLPWVALLLDGGCDPRALNLGWHHRASAVASIALVGAAATRRPRLAAAAAASLVALNASFYSLLVRRRGPVQALAGVPLHVLHHLTGGAALAAGVALRAARDRESRRRP